MVCKVKGPVQHATKSIGHMVSKEIDLLLTLQRVLDLW